jgi:hypothetical protein
MLMRRTLLVLIFAGAILCTGIPVDAHHSFAATYITDKTQKIEGGIGQPGRDAADHRLRMVNITRPSDGWKWEGRFN